MPLLAWRVALERLRVHLLQALRAQSLGLLLVQLVEPSQEVRQVP